MLRNLEAEVLNTSDWEIELYIFLLADFVVYAIFKFNVNYFCTLDADLDFASPFHRIFLVGAGEAGVKKSQESESAPQWCRKDGQTCCGREAA